MTNATKIYEAVRDCIAHKFPDHQLYLGQSPDEYWTVILIDKHIKVAAYLYTPEDNDESTLRFEVMDGVPSLSSLPQEFSIDLPDDVWEEPGPLFDDLPKALCKHLVGMQVEDVRDDPTSYVTDTLRGMNPSKLLDVLTDTVDMWVEDWKVGDWDPDEEMDEVVIAMRDAFKALHGGSGPAIVDNMVMMAPTYVDCLQSLIDGEE